MEKKAASRMIFVFCVHECVFIVVVCVIKSKKFEIQRHFFKANENVFHNCTTFSVCDFGYGFRISNFLHQSKTTKQPESLFIYIKSYVVYQYKQNFEKRVQMQWMVLVNQTMIHRILTLNTFGWISVCSIYILHHICLFDLQLELWVLVVIWIAKYLTFCQHKMK